MQVALVGAGSVVRSLYLPLLTRGDSPFRVANVYDIDPLAARGAAELLGARVAEDLSRALGDEVSAVFVCVPKEHHLEVVLAALGNGLHVLCEKPLGRNGTEARQMLDAAESAGVTHMVNFAYRFRPGPAVARSLLWSGGLGMVYHVSGVLAQGSWFTADGLPNLMRPYATPWRFGPTGGVIRDLGPHLLDMCLPLGKVERVQGWTKTIQAAADAPEDASGFSLSFADGAIAHLLTSRWATGHWENLAVEISGSLGAVRFNRQEASIFRDYGDGSEWRPALAAPEQTFLEVFRRAIAGQAEDVPTFRDATLNNTILDAVLLSAESGATVGLSPDSSPASRSAEPAPGP